MSEAIVITSGKGGVGKTTTVANIGTGLAMLGRKVVVVDTDIGLRNLDVVLGLENRIVYNLVDVIGGNCRLRQALIKDKRFDDLLYLLPAAQNAEKDALEPEQVVEIVEQLRPDFDFIILDSPAGIEQGFRNATGAADGAIVVTTPEISAVSDADRVVGLLEQREMPIKPRLVINRIRQNMLADGRSMDIDEITSHLGLDLLGIIVDDDGVIASSNKGEAIVMNPDDLASKGYRNIARRLLGDSVPLMDIRIKKQGFWSKLFHRHD